MAEPALPTPTPGRRDVAFAVAQALLVAVALWWVVLLRAETEATLELERRVEHLEAQAAAVRITREREPAAVRSLVPDGWRLESAAASALPADTIPLPGRDLVLTRTAEAESAWAERRRSRRLMVAGEGALLVLLVGVSVLLLTRLVLAERRRRRETQAFLARVSHEMKTPLAGLKALLQGLAAGRVPARRRGALLALGRAQAERHGRLVDLLVHAGRARRASGRVHRPLDVPACLARWAARREPGEDTDHRISVVTASGDGPLVASVSDPEEIEIILDNLADNAFKYGASRLVIRVELRARSVAVVVEDDGCGFPSADARRIFRPFRRGDGPASRHGSGLGLAIARDLARRSDGDLVAESEGPGQGARFTLLLPRRRAPGRRGGSLSAAACGTIVS